MNKPIYVGLATGKTLRLIFAVVLLVLAGRTFNANPQTVTNLYPFAGPPNDGGSPAVGLVQGSDGNFYGTTSYGGTNTQGTVFRISPSGTYTILHEFPGYRNDGFRPFAGLVQGSDGNFYGTTAYGGTSSSGTVFRISPSGSETVIYPFAGPPNDGYYPLAGLVQATDGNFYGTTSLGGTNNGGTIFRISPSGSYTTLYSFVGYPTDGQNPQAGLVQGSDGNFYGTTVHGGGSDNCPPYTGCGTVFRISPSGNETTLHSFVGYPSDGVDPAVGLVQGSDGNFYGTTSEGGTNGAGTVFRISPNGSETNLHSFGTALDGNQPLAGLVQGSDGNFYGTTHGGGTNRNCNCGTVFRISPSGSETTLYSFGSYPDDGSQPQAGLVQGSDGNFYGTTYGGGTNGYGTVFRLTVPLDPPPYPINQITGVHVAATNIVFNVVSIAGETYQLQFSGSMKPTNWINVAVVSVTNSIGSLLTLTNFGGVSQPQGFYRFDITP